MRTNGHWKVGSQRELASRGCWMSLLAVAVVIAAGVAQAASNKLHVSNNGADSATCGGVDSPCRSISRAIAHASPGDTIIVGPGLYGDVNRDGVVDPSGDSGEEAPAVVDGLEVLGKTLSLAMIRIDKRLTIVSRDGAGSTFIVPHTEVLNGSYIAVAAAADGVVFGKSRKGFTISNASVGVHVEPVSGVKVSGIRTEFCEYGFMAGGPFSPAGESSSGTAWKGNVAARNIVIGFAIVDTSAAAKGNLAEWNQWHGFVFSGGATLTKNLAVANGGAGFLLAVMDGAAPLVSKNAAIHNGDAGIFVATNLTAATDMTLKRNTLFGNGEEPQYPPYNCGLTVQNQGTQALTIDADDNYWGAPTGPGANPADSFGGACNAGAVVVNLSEWSSVENKVMPPTMR